jgi:hypothetical protein
MALRNLRGCLANLLASIVESAHVTARFATAMRFPSGKGYSKAVMTSPCRKQIRVPIREPDFSSAPMSFVFVAADD